MALTMSGCRATCLLLISILAGTLSTSCGPSHSQPIPRKADKRVLSEQELIAIATAVGRQYVPDPERWVTTIDRENEGLKHFAAGTYWSSRHKGKGLVPMWPPADDAEAQTMILDSWPALKGHDYQAVCYSNPGALDGSLEMLIDRHTGDVLLILDGLGRVVKPQSGHTGPSGKRALPARELIAIAAAAGRQYERDPNDYVPVMDEGNASWDSGNSVIFSWPEFDATGNCTWHKPTLDEIEEAKAKRWPMLKGHDYQVLWYHLLERPRLVIPRDYQVLQPGELMWSPPFVDVRNFDIKDLVRAMSDWTRAILIDRNTGEVLVVMDNWGEVLAPASGSNRRSGRRVLLKQEMLDIADAVGGRYGRASPEWKAVIDEGNARWKRFATSVIWPRTSGSFARPQITDAKLEAAIIKRWPVLLGRDYQALFYTLRYPNPWRIVEYSGQILIDRNTGGVLLAPDRWGHPLQPDMK